jgi:hypothetical protein
MRPTTTLKQAAIVEQRRPRSITNGTIQLQGRCCVQFVKGDMGVYVMGRGLLLWLLGIPLPIILLVWLLGGLHG